MGRYDSSVRCAQIRELIEEKQYLEAMEEIEELRFEEVPTITDLYLFANLFLKAEKMDIAKELYYTVYHRTSSRPALYRLLLLTIRMGDLEEAKELYQAYEIVSGMTLDTYELKYRLAKAEGASYETLIEILEELKKDWSKRVTGLAILEAAPEQLHTEIDGVKIEANFDNFMDWLRQAALDEVYVDIPMDSGDSFVPYLKEMESMGLTVHFRLPVLDRIEKACCDETSAVRISRELSRCAGGNVVTMGTVELKLRDQVLKRTMDIVGGIVGCIISIPIIALVAIPLKLESPGPLVFKQRRVGRNGRVFYIHKLRSMYVDAEERKKELMARNEMNGLMFKMQDDPRITKVGKFIRKTSIDELPQFFDVLRGDMSLVGTRPPTLDEYKQYESHHKRRLSMKPGITGLWQVSGRSNIEDFEEVVKLDTRYIDNWTIWQDLKILLKTVWVVFAGRGAE